MIPRCYTCNAYINRYHVEFTNRKRLGEEPKAILDALNIDRMCCRTHMITHVDLHRDFQKFPNTDMQLDDTGSVLYRHVKFSRRISCDTGHIDPVLGFEGNLAEGGNE